MTTGDGTVALACQHCDSKLGSATVLGPEDAPVRVDVWLVIDCAVCLREAMTLVRYEVTGRA